MIKTLAERLQAIRAKGQLHRTATVGAIDTEARTVELSFSSETDTVERWFGIEVLGHDAGEVDLSRLNNGAPVLWMHNARDQRGVVVSARIDGDRVGRAVVRFSRSPEGDQLFQDIVDGIVTKVSVGYEIGGIKLVEERNGVDVYRVTSWQPNEISLVSVPADDTVGVGRSAEPNAGETQADPGEIEAAPATASFTNKRAVSQMIKYVRDAAGNLVRAEVNEDGSVANVLEIVEEAGAGIRTAAAQGGAAERSRTSEIAALGIEYGRTDLAAEFSRDGKSADEFKNALLGDFAAKRAGAKPLGDQVAETNLGLTDKEVQRYSILNVVRALANPLDQRAREAAAFEIECSRAAEQQLGKVAVGMLVPTDVLGSNRAFNAGGAANTPAGSTSGAMSVATDLHAGSFIDMLRKKTTIMQLGRPMAGLVGNVEIPKQNGGATAYWGAEGADALEGTPTLGQVALTPKTVSAFTDITRKLLLQSSVDVEALVIGDIRAAMSQAIDFAGFYGTGATNQPRGLKNYSGINAVDFAAAGLPTFAEFVAMETAIASDNADIESMAYVFNAAMRGHCKTAPRFGAGTESTIWEAGGTVNGYRAEVTNQIAAGDVFHGNFADLIVALWGGLDLVVDTAAKALSGGLRIIAHQDTDFVLRREESICYGVAVP